MSELQPVSINVNVLPAVLRKEAEKHQDTMPSILMEVAAQSIEALIKRVTIAERDLESHIKSFGHPKYRAVGSHIRDGNK